MFKTVRRLLSEVALRVRLALFGNNHSVLLNLRYAKYHRAAAKKWRPMVPTTAQANETATLFAREGWVVLPSAVDDVVAAAIGRRVDALFDSGGEFRFRPSRTSD
jgi:hypothetical protein